MTDTVTVTLATPITHGGKTYQELTFREATTGDIAAADAVTGEFGKSLAVLACMADVPIQVMKAIPVREFGKLTDQVSSLMGESPAAA